MVNNIEDIINHSMAFIEDDYTELWVIASKVQDDNRELDFVGILEATKEVIRELVEKNNIKVLNEDTLEPMKLDVKEILRLVEDKFRTLGKIPNIGDGIWFTL